VVLACRYYNKIAYNYEFIFIFIILCTPIRHDPLTGEIE